MAYGKYAQNAFESAQPLFAPLTTPAAMLTLLPATATVVGIVVLGHIPSRLEWTGIAMVIAAVAIHRRAQ